MEELFFVSYEVFAASAKIIFPVHGNCSFFIPRHGMNPFPTVFQTRSSTSPMFALKSTELPRVVVNERNLLI